MVSVLESLQEEEIVNFLSTEGNENFWKKLNKKSEAVLLVSQVPVTVTVTISFYMYMYNNYAVITNFYKAAVVFMLSHASTSKFHFNRMETSIPILFTGGKPFTYV